MAVSPTLTLSNDATIDFENGVNSVTFDGTYESYRLILSNITISVDDREIYIRVKESGAFQSGVSDYDFTVHGQDSISNATVVELGSTASGILIVNSGTNQSMSNISGGNLNATITIPDPVSTSLFKNIYGDCIYNRADGKVNRLSVGGRYNQNTNDITGVQVALESGVFVSGTAVLLGLVS